MGKKVFIFGIDGAPPELIFNKWLGSLPNIKKLMLTGTYTNMNSSIPPSTIIAWNSMMSGKDASEIGVFSYTFKDVDGNISIVDSNKIKCKLLWDRLSENGKKSLVLFVPMSYPVKKINGTIVSGFLTPSVESDCAYPEKIKEIIRDYDYPDIFFDVSVGLAGHKGLEIEPLLEKTYQMTDMQIKLLKDQISNGNWDFCMTVLIGSDRLQHMLWRHFDETHRRFIKDSPYKDSLKDYYIYLDKKLGEVLELLDDNTVIMVVSDHGMVKQEGKININNWLIEQGYLVLKNSVDLNEKKKFSTDYVDMSKTIAFAGGAYNARININKEKVGSDYDKIKQELIDKILKITDDNGNKINTMIFKSEDIYKDLTSPECPDLIIYFDDLRWASNPDLGQAGIYSWHTALGADSAGHSRQGCFIISGNGITKKGKIKDIGIQRVAPTILKIMGLDIPKDIEAKPIDLD